MGPVLSGRLGIMPRGLGTHLEVRDSSYPSVGSAAESGPGASLLAAIRRPL